MRLGTLAKELDQKYTDLESVLVTEFSIKNEKGPNFKLEEVHITFLQEIILLFDSVLGMIMLLVLLSEVVLAVRFEYSIIKGRGAN